jgi:hypothetical protein
METGGWRVKIDLGRAIVSRKVGKIGVNPA